MICKTYSGIVRRTAICMAVVAVFCDCMQTRSEDALYPGVTSAETLVNSGETHESVPEWGQYSFLASVGEPMLQATDTTQTNTYRLYWARAFHPAVILRLEQAAGRETVLHVKRVVESSPPKGSHGSQIERIDSKQIVLSSTKADNFLNLFRQAHFNDRSEVDESNRGEDGSMWFFEAKIGGQYHYTRRYNPLPPLKWGGGSIEEPVVHASEASEECALSFAGFYLICLGAPEEELY